MLVSSPQRILHSLSIAAAMTRECMITEHTRRARKRRSMLRLFSTRVNLAHALEHVLALLRVLADFRLIVGQRKIERIIDAVDVMDIQSIELFW